MDFREFLAKDKKLKRYLDYEIVVPSRTKNVMLSLVSSIMGQQLSTIVAQVMYKRFLELYGNKTPTPQMVSATPVATIKAIGISQRKAEYIQNVASFIVEKKITLAELNKMSDEEIIDLLTQIKGVGRWTVEMLLMFGLGREDVFAVDDLGVQKAMIEIFKLQDLKKSELTKKMLSLSKRWSPYRSYVCLYMWKYNGFKES